MCVASALLAAAILSTSAFAQNPRGARSGSAADSGQGPYFGAGPYSAAVVTGVPYSADGVSQNIQTLADGTHIAGNPFSLKFYRDSLGRTRRESLLLRGDSSSGISTAPPLVAVEITDPVAQLKYILDSVNKLARRQHLDASTPQAAPPSTNRGTQRQEPEQLGAQTIEGILCEGTRTITIWPVGTKGNDRPLSIVSEVWKSPELQLIVLNKLTNPQTGERTQKLMNISRAEPPLGLFRPPLDYRLVDEPNDVYHIRGDVSAPVLIHKVEPKYSNEARKAKFSGSVLLSIVVDEKGLPSNIEVLQPLGLGLDQKAIDAVKKWRFRPGTKADRPVPVVAQVEVSFRLL